MAGAVRALVAGDFAAILYRRLGCEVTAADLNPVAWFVVKQEFAKPDLDAVKRLLADVEAEVNPQIMPFYACEGPGGDD